MIKNSQYNDYDIEEALKSYCSDFGFIPINLFNLTSYGPDTDLCLLGLVRDIRINLVFCNIDYIKSGFKNYSAKYNKQFFVIKDLLYCQHYVSNFIFKFRAIGDKIMRLIIHLHASNKEKKQFDKAQSKIKAFAMICNNYEALKNIPKYQIFLENLMINIEQTKLMEWAEIFGILFLLKKKLVLMIQ